MSEQILHRGVVVAHEVRGSNPVIGKFILNVCCQLQWKDENKEKRCHEWPIFKNKFFTAEIWLDVVNHMTSLN